jgi:hypothetical protein
MKNILILFLLVILSFSCTNTKKSWSIYSPDGKNKITVNTDAEGDLQYSLSHDNKVIISESGFYFEFTDSSKLGKNLSILSADTSSFSEKWQMPWGEQLEVENNYRELFITLSEQNSDGKKINMRFRVFNDGAAFRYEFPEQGSLKELKILNEFTSFKLTGNHKVWWIPGDWDCYEHLYNTTDFNKINATAKRGTDLAQTTIPYNAVNTPVTMKTPEGLYLSFHEAALVNYPDMTLEIDTNNLAMQSRLVSSDITGYAAQIPIPFNTPWRTIQIAGKAGDLIESKMILNLNEPNKLGNIDWFKPTKYTGIWWEMHLGKSTWDFSATQDMNTFTGKRTKARHGATTENAKAFIDFSAQKNIGAVLIEGWNTGWEHWIGFDDREGVFDFVTPYPDYDLDEIVKYGKSKGVEIIMHHETSSAPRTYDKQLDTAYALMQKLGIHAVKTGYVGKIIPKGEFHHGQWMVNHYAKTVETAARYQIAVNIHEPIKATGLRRTYPNLISREGLRGQEFNAWAADGGNPPEHLSIVAFTRMLAGPIDFTPGIFNIKLKPYKPDNQVNTTLAQQLALYVVIYSPIQMAADLIENYQNQPAFQFIRDVAVDWQKTKVLDGEPGDFVVIARKEKNSENWFIGGITDENEREISINFDFLNENVTYKAVIYKDAADAHWNNNPLAINIDTLNLNNKKTEKIKMAQGGGFAISIIATK